MADDLYDLRCALLLGNYATAINEGTGRATRGGGSGGKASSAGGGDEASQWERDFILLRAHLALRQYDVVTGELSKKGPAEPAKAFASFVAFLKAQEAGNTEGMALALEKMAASVVAVKEGMWQANTSTAICAATAYIRDRQVTMAMPPRRASRIWRLWPHFSATVRRTRTASRVTSVPIPSPGRTRMLRFKR